MKRLALLVCLLLVACGNANATERAALTPPASAALVQQVVGLLLDRYVDPLDSATLYAAAYRGAADAVQAAGLTPEGRAPDFTGNSRRDAELFREAYLTLAREAAPKVDPRTLAYGAIGAVTKTIDECHTAFLTPEQYRQVTAGLEGTANYAGIGVGIRPATRPVVISEVFPDSPAARSGLRPGDAILAVNGTDVADLPADQIAQLVRGPAGTQVTLTIRRPGEEAPREIAITRAQVPVPVLTSDIKTAPDGSKIGYIKLYSFSRGADEELQRALERFREEGVAGLVLDLRGNGGGYIDTLEKIASRFISDSKPVAYTVERGGEREAIRTDPSLYATPQRPLAILIDAGSASSSEALAAAARDYGFARLFGETTAGCLATASTFQLEDGSAVQITLEKVVSPEGREINRVGQAPDEAVAPSPASAADPVLEAALRWLAGQQGAGASAR